MKAAAPAFCLVLTACFVRSPPMQFGAGKSPGEAQRQELGEMLPPQLVADKTYTGKVEVVKVRVWADDDYRAQNVKWQEMFKESLEYANTVLEAQLGIRLEPEYREWSHHAPAATLEEDLEELGRVDPGTDVFEVIGLTSSQGLVSATFDQIGVGSLPGNHLVLRGFPHREEAALFDRAFPRIAVDERESVLIARRRHKTTTLLLHELGHNLGAPHEPDVTIDSIMDEAYSDHAAAFSDRARWIMLASLDARLHRNSAPAGDGKARHPSLIVRVTPAGQTMVGGMDLDDATFTELLRQSYENDPDTEVIIKADRGTPQPVVIRVFDRARATGIPHVELGTPDAP